jgi:hypothetical protein
MTYLKLMLAGRNRDTPFVVIGTGDAGLYGYSLVPENSP